MKVYMVCNDDDDAQLKAVYAEQSHAFVHLRSLFDEYGHPQVGYVKEIEIRESPPQLVKVYWYEFVPGEQGNHWEAPVLYDNYQGPKAWWSSRGRSGVWSPRLEFVWGYSHVSPEHAELLANNLIAMLERRL